MVSTPPAAKRPNLRADQKRRTLALLRDTARALFYEHGYHSVSVDQIAEAAGTSRATFYLYFRNKPEILECVLQDDLAEQMKVYQQLAAMDEPSWQKVRDWLTAFRAEMEERQKSLPLFSFAFDGASERSAMSISHRDNAIEVLGKRFPAFDLSGLSPDQHRRKRARLFLVLMMIEQVAMAYSFGVGSPDIGEGLDILADELLAFLMAGDRAAAARRGGEGN